MISRPARHGYTLVEILVVVLLLGIAAMAAQAAYMNRAPLEVESAARVLRGHLQFARDRAAGRGEPHYLVVGENSVGVATLAGSGFAYVQTPFTPDDMILHLGNGDDTQHRDVFLTATDFDGRSVFGFDADGIPTGYGTSGGGGAMLMEEATFTLDCRGNHFVVAVSPIAGHVTLR